MKILAVDDEVDMETLIRQRFRKQIKEQIYQFEFARDGNEALMKLNQHPDIYMVLTDINMPGMDGLTLLKKINELDRPIQTIVVSAYGDIKNIRTAMNEGAFDFLVKPIDFQDFEITINTSLENIRFVLGSKETKEQLENERIEKIKAQEEALKHLEENAKLISEQNIMLEKKVAERTLELQQKNEIITREMERSEQLLLNILPAETAEELKQTGAAESKSFDVVTVLFTDFKNFTMMSEMMTAKELVNEINYCYSAFDTMITKHGIEKIKTIGDSYMCAGGLPVKNDTNPIDTVNAALEIRDFMLAERERRIAEGKLFFEIRIGIHTGPVVAGIVGIKKFAYDIWGDTVNIASRMESSSEPGKVNISGSTYEKVKTHFNCEYRGKVMAKNKGDVDMYYVEAKP